MAQHPDFLIRARDFEPAYLKLYTSGELARRAAEAVATLTGCRTCPRRCNADRTAGRSGPCRTGRSARVSAYFAHPGEEDCLRGWRGSGTIFFTSCSLRCVFCQNAEISQGRAGEEMGPERLAEVMLELQALGCHNINLVTPEHVVAQILEALPHAVAGGLRIPLVYNTSSYDAVESLRRLDGIVDIYLPDFKMWDPQRALRYLSARDYPAAARRAIAEMQRQVGPLRLDEDGLARRGVLVRHLVMPGGLAGTRPIMRFLAAEISPDTCVNLMDQYHPADRVGTDRFSEIDRRISTQEYAAAVDAARAAGIHRLI